MSNEYGDSFMDRNGKHEGTAEMRVLRVTVEFARYSPDVERLLVSHANGLWQADGLLETFWARDGSTVDLQQVFQGEAAARAYLSSPALKRLASHPDCIDFFVREFDAVDDLNRLSRCETGIPAVEATPALAV